MAPPSRIGCLWVAGLALAALQRVDPELCGRSVAVVDESASRRPIWALSPEAEAAGVRLGMTGPQACAVDDALLVRPRHREAERAAMRALADVAQTVSARVEVEDEGVVYFDCAGSAALCASEHALAGILVARAARQGLAVWVGVADGKLAARLAARAGRGVEIVPPGGSRARLAPLPIAVLEPAPALAATLRSWGLRSIGDLARVPAGAAAHRLGPAGARLVRLARGEDDAPLAACPTPHVFTETIELDDAIERLEPLVFVLRRLLECLTRRLALHGLACAALDLDLQLAGGGRSAHRLVVAAPTTESRTLLTLLRAHVERIPPRRAVCGVTLGGEAARVRAAQLDLFRPSGPPPVVLAATIARLAALCGSDRVGAPARTASHRPDAVTLVPFPGGADACAASDADRCREGASGYGPSVIAPVALRAFRPPAPLTIFESAGRLDYVRGPGFGGRVVHVAGPWRLRGEWWTADPFAREYYDVELSDGGVYRIYHDGRSRCWLADGLYD